MNILYITHRLPYPPDKGDRIRNWNVLKYLARQGEVSLATLTDEPVSADALRMLEETTARVACVPVDGWSRKSKAIGSLFRGKSISEGMFESKVLGTTIRDWARESRFDFAVCSASSVAHYLKLPELQGARTCVDFVDVDSQKWRDYADASAIPKRWLYALEAKRVHSLESEILNWADGATLVSDQETNLFARLHAPANACVRTATNGVDLDYFAPQPEADAESQTLAFVGAFDYKPNIDGALWFCKEIFPELRRTHSDLSVRLVGRNPTADVKKLAEIDGVEVVGTVPDVRPYVAKALAVIAPLRIARGLQNKVLEAFAMGKAVVASPSALGGFRSEAEVPALRAKTPADWQAHVDRLISDGEFRRERGKAGRDYAETHHDWNTCLEPIGQFLPRPALLGTHG